MTKCNRLIDLGARGHIECENEATHRITLELRNNPTHDPVEAILGLVVCAEHKNLTWNNVVSAAGWKQICDSFAAQGYAAPSPKHSKVVVKPI